jgi:hypothetical protein
LAAAVGDGCKQVHEQSNRQAHGDDDQDVVEQYARRAISDCNSNSSCERKDVQRSNPQDPADDTKHHLGDTSGNPCEAGARLPLDPGEREAEQHQRIIAVPAETAMMLAGTQVALRTPLSGSSKAAASHLACEQMLWRSSARVRIDYRMSQARI